MRSPDTIRKIADPARRFAAASTALEEARQLVSDYSAIRRDTVKELRQTMSHGRVGELLGLSRGRVQQLEK